MPVLRIEIVAYEDETAADSLATDLAKAAGAIFDRPTGRTWVRVNRLARDDYAEDGGVPADVAPVFVEVLLRSLPPQEERRRLVRALAQAIGEVCGRPTENVHITLLPAAAGRVAFGGELVD